MTMSEKMFKKTQTHVMCVCCERRHLTSLSDCCDSKVYRKYSIWIPLEWC